MIFEQVVREIHRLSIEQRKALIMILVDSLTKPETSEKTHSILEFEGIGERLRNEVDAQDYVSQLRSEWDHRP